MDTVILIELAALVKRKCKITWRDDDTEQRVNEIVENADETMRHMLGMKDASADAFLQAGKARTLFENYCMYDWNNMVDQFEANYRKDILAERHRNEVKNHAESDSDI